MPELTHEQRFVALLCGSNDPYFPQVASRCDDSLKRMRAANCESASFVGYIFELYLGSPPETRADSRRSPVPPALRLKLLGYLNRSATAAATFPQWLQVIFQSMFGDDTSNKLRRQGMQFLHWVIRMTPQEQISRAAPVLLQGVRKILTETTAPGGASAVDNDIIRGSAYVAWGTLTKRVAELASSDQNHLQAIFDAFDI
ncbi:proteasome component M29, partial [Coemansia sp. RSA 2322]